MATPNSDDVQDKVIHNEQSCPKCGAPQTHGGRWACGRDRHRPEFAQTIMCRHAESLRGERDTARNLLAEAAGMVGAARMVSIGGIGTHHAAQIPTATVRRWKAVTDAK